MTPPRLFISYSWSSQEHETWVINLAESLVESGVDVILDKWDLKEGHDSIVFMESMVNDPNIKKVIMICDEIYAAKANDRQAGVGTETQIISKQVYEQQDQSKFVAVLSERSPEGKPFLPAYYTNRIYIDLSSSDRYASEFEQLVRWIFDKPRHVRPELGEPPAFLNDERARSLGTFLLFNRGIDALKNGKSYIDGAVDDYLQKFALSLEGYRIDFTAHGGLGPDEIIAKNIAELEPYKAEFEQLIMSIARYAPTANAQKNLHRFFEALAPYLDRPEQVTRYHDYCFDNFRFFIHEIFLYTIAIFLQQERFTLVEQLLGTPYYVSSRADRGEDVTTTFSVFRQSMPSSDIRNTRLGRVSTRADMLMERAKKSGFNFNWLMQADFILYVRASLGGSPCERWWPETLVYAVQARNPMEVFARSKSSSYYEQLRGLFGGLTAQELKAHIAKLEENHDLNPKWGFFRISPSILAGVSQLASIP